MTIGGYKLNNLMSNSTQNKVFNDLPKKDQKKIIRGAMKHAKKLQDEVLTQNDEIGKMEKAIDEGFAESERDLKDKKTPLDQPTQNDWEKRYDEFITFVTNEKNWIDGRPVWKEYKYVTLANAIKYFIRKELADARREVIKRIESMPDKDVRPEITVWLEPKEYCLGYNKALQDVLVTLKEEGIEK